MKTLPPTGRSVKQHLQSRSRACGELREALLRVKTSSPEHKERQIFISVNINVIKRWPGPDTWRVFGTSGGGPHVSVEVGAVLCVCVCVIAVQPFYTRARSPASGCTLPTPRPSVAAAASKRSLCFRGSRKILSDPRECRSVVGLEWVDLRVHATTHTRSCSGPAWDGPSPW